MHEAPNTAAQHPLLQNTPPHRLIHIYLLDITRRCEGTFIFSEGRCNTKIDFHKF